jgi:general stress protein YciG
VRLALDSPKRDDRIDSGKERRREAMAKRGPQPGTPQAKRGGEKVKEKYGAEFYKMIGKKGGDAVKKKYGPNFYEEIGKKGGDTTRERHGVEFFEKIGKKGGRR